MSRKTFALLCFVTVASLILSACEGETVEVTRVVQETVVEKETVVETVVEKETVLETVVEKETVVETVVEKETVVEEKEVEVVVTATPEPAPGEMEVPTEMQMGGTLNIWQPNGWPEQSWPHRSNWESSWAISPMRERLFWAHSDGSLEPWLATDWEVSDDGLVYTVTLRDDVTWHDGEPFTAEDVKYSLELRLSPELRPLNEARYGQTVVDLLAYHEGEAEEITGVTVIDEHTIQFELAEPDAAFPRLFLADSNGVPELVPMHIIETLDREEVMNGTADYWYTNPVGTGPYKFVRYETDQFIEYERNEDYWGDPVGPEQLFLKIASPEVAVVLLQQGEVDFLNPLQLTEAERLQEDPNVEVLVADNNAQWYGLEMNYYTMDGFWRDPRAKQAFLYSIDRQAYVDSILQGFGVVRHSFFDGTPYECPTKVEYNYDPERADELWTELGYPQDARGDVVIDLMSWLGIKARLDYLPIAQEFLRQLGFTVNVDLIDNSLINEYRQGEGPRGKDWDFHVLLFGPGTDPGTVAPFLLPDSQANWGVRSWPFPPNPDTGLKDDPYVYDNPRVNELLGLAAAETDPEQRKEYFQEIDCIWNEELPALMTASPSFVAAKSARLQGVDWQENAGLGKWTEMYKPGSWWIYEP
jgi:peptide/nickel transport system substrate-binding protein